MGKTKVPVFDPNALNDLDTTAAATMPPTVVFGGDEVTVNTATSAILPKLLENTTPPATKKKQQAAEGANKTKPTQFGDDKTAEALGGLSNNGPKGW